MRLDLFLPSLRAGLPTPRGVLLNAARRILPAAWFSDVPHARPGLARRLLKRLGPTWLAAPLCRAAQSLGLLLFLVLLFHVCWPYSAQPEPHAAGWPSHYSEALRAKEIVEAESWLALDPLVSISTALAARVWVWPLAWAGVMLAICLFVPRGFCGYLCPLGTLLDLFDWAVGRRVTRFRVARDGWWVHLKYYLLLGVLVAAACGVLLSGFVAAIPVLTRGMVFILAPLQLGFMRGWHQVPPFNAGHFISIALFAGVLALGFMRPRFWCRHVCPSGAVFSVFNLWRVSERKVAASCIRCNQCVEICPFDAIKADFTTRTADCTFCQTCGGVCPVRAIRFVDRWDRAGLGLKKEGEPETHETALARRGFLIAALGALPAAAGMRRVLDGAAPLVRPPGSVPEEQFLRLCIRCAECFKVCPNSVLQPAGFEHGLDALWTPQVAADWAGCESSCAACGQVCPTGAIRALPLEEKKVARMGLAGVNMETCLPYAGREACRMCVDECAAAGYQAIEFVRVRIETDERGAPIEDTGFLAPVVVPDACVGCGLCQTRCYQINVKSKGWLRESAIIVTAGVGKEDRLMSGSYVALRTQEAARRQEEQRKLNGQAGASPGQDTYLPDFLGK
jgi:ferredoxin